MKATRFWIAGLAVVASPPAVSGQPFEVGTAFTYQGRLLDDGVPASGPYDFEFILYDDPGAGNPVGGPINVDDWPVSEGLFTVTIDFGSDVFSGDARWLGMGVRPTGSGGPYTYLFPLQELTPAPHALALPGLHTQQNATSPNLIGGFSGNSVTGGVVGATVSGGGEAGAENRVTEAYGTVSGGLDNQAGGGSGRMRAGSHATVGGGHGNTASGQAATVPGGEGNSASGSYSFAAGRRANADHNGAFVWADSTDADFDSTASDQFLIRAAGGVGIGTDSPASSLHVASTGSRAVFGENASTTGLANGVHGESDSTTGRGVFGKANGASGETHGVHGEAASPDGKGVYGKGGASGI
ncbi:MAG: hypothetical protein ACYS7M_03855, partial [Planctomycetota bacterium]